MVQLGLRVFESDGAILCGRVFVGLLLIASGVVKLLDIDSFADVVQAFALLPGKLAASVARLIPLGECLIGGLLLLAVASPHSDARRAAMAAMALFAVFAGAVAINLMRGRRNIACGCFAAMEDDQLTWFLVARNCALAVVGYLAFRRLPFYSDDHAAGFGGRLGAALVGLSMLLAWQLATAIVRLGAYSHEGD